MGRLLSSGVVGVRITSRGRPPALRSPERAGAPGRGATWLASALGIGATAVVAAMAWQLAEALRTPGIGGFPPIP
jgi:hypothetical protein